MFMLILALFIVFLIGFLAMWNIRLFMRTFTYDSINGLDLFLSVFTGAGLAFLFYYLT